MMSEVKMTQQIDYKISSKHGGITLEDITIDQALVLTDTIVGTKGPYKVTISWEDNGIDEPEPTEELIVEPESEQELESKHVPPEPITSHINQTDLPQAADHITQKTPVIEPTPAQEPDPAPAHPVIFNELDRISKAKLAKYIDIDVFNMGYHDQGDGKIIICYGTTKVYTSWENMFKLPIFIDNESIKELNNLKQVAVRHFRKWMTEHSDLLPDGVDPDAEFRSAGVGQSVYPPESPAGQDFGKGISEGGF
jgi:hypothetical protein